MHFILDEILKLLTYSIISRCKLCDLKNSPFLAHHVLMT